MKIQKKTIVIIYLIVIAILALIGIVNMIHSASKNEVDSKSIDELINEKKYTTIKQNKEILNIFNSIKKYVYNTNREGLSSFSKTELFSIIGYNIKKENITDIKEEDTYSYGYIKKELLDQQIQDIFGKENIRIALDSEDKSKKTINGGVFENAGDKFKNAVLMEVTKKQYYFRFYRNEGISACPQMKNIPIKLMEVRQIDNYILLKAKSVLTRVVETEENQCTVDIINYNVKDPLDTFKVEMGSTPYTIDIDKYTENAMDVYIVLKKGKRGKYYFSESKIGE